MMPIETIEIVLNKANMDAQITKMQTLEEKITSRSLNFQLEQCRGSSAQALTDTQTAMLEMGQGLAVLVHDITQKLILARDSLIQADENIAASLR
ncbi:MAG TPA: hypothetical protein H9795_07735 [Candidatus Fournierella merdigallinarum]|nr:hypothetical protein [Candidatus Fournierella merdigallinarum]